MSERIPGHTPTLQDGEVRFRKFEEAYQRATGGALKQRGVNQMGTPQFEGRCPAHDDKKPSLSVTYNDQGVTCKCHKGCSRDAVASKLGLSIAEWATHDVGRRRARHAPASRSRATRKVLNSLDNSIAYLESKKAWNLVSKHRYTGKSGEDRFYVLRFVPRGGGSKRFRTAVSRGKEKWAIERPKGDRLPLYRLPEVVAATDIWICEGEKCADRLSAIGLVATTTAFGASNVRSTTLQPLAGKSVLILIDNDHPGRQYAAAIVAKAQRFHPRPRQLVIIDLNEFVEFDPACTPLEQGEDVADWLDRLPSTYGNADRQKLLRKIAATAAIQSPPGWLARHGPKKLKEIPMGPMNITVHPERYGNLVVAGSSVTRTDEAQRWILGVLRDGPVRSPQVREAARAEGLTPSTLRDARDRLKDDGHLEFRREAGGQSWSLTPEGQKIAEAKRIVEKGPRRPHRRPR